MDLDSKWTSLLVAQTCYLRVVFLSLLLLAASMGQGSPEIFFDCIIFSQSVIAKGRRVKYLLRAAWVLFVLVCSKNKPEQIRTFERIFIYFSFCETLSMVTSKLCIHAD